MNADEMTEILLLLADVVKKLARIAEIIAESSYRQAEELQRDS